MTKLLLFLVLIFNLFGCQEKKEMKSYQLNKKQDIAETVIGEKEELIYHNSLINNLTSEIVRIKLMCNEWGVKGEKFHQIEIENAEEIKNFVQLLLIQNIRQNTDSFHKCNGNIKIQLISNNKTYFISYDHGKGIYPLYKDENRPVGFIDLGETNCSKLNSYLESKGFSRNEIGY